MEPTPATTKTLLDRPEPTPPSGKTWRHLIVSFLVVAGFALAIALLRMVDAPGDLDLTTPVLLLFAILTAEYRLLHLRKQSLHRVIYRPGSFLGRMLGGKFTALLTALGMAVSTTVGFTIWAISADPGAILIVSVCTFSAAALLALFLDLVETQTLDPHSRYVAIALAGSAAGILTAAWLGHHIWTHIPQPLGIPKLIERTAFQLDERNDLIGLTRAAALMVNEAQLIIISQIEGVGLKLIYVAASLLIVFLVMRSALVVVAALTLRPLLPLSGPQTGPLIAVPASIALFSIMAVLAALMTVAAPVEDMVRRVTTPAGELARINRIVTDAYRPVHDAAAGFSARHLDDWRDEGGLGPKLATMTPLIRDELLMGLEQRLEPAIDPARPDEDGFLQQSAAATIAQTLAVADLLSAGSNEDTSIQIARDLCRYFELGWLRCTLVKTLAGSAPASTMIQFPADQRQIALHAAIERAATGTKLQLARATMGLSTEAR